MRRPRHRLSPSPSRQVSSCERLFTEANPSAPAARTGDVLRELRIENLLLIERAELRLGEGLNAITGETGAGKTVLAHALDLLTGGRARPQIVRPGAEEAWVEGVFDLPEELRSDPELALIADRLPTDADEIVLGRRIGTSGRTSAFVGGRAATAADLQLLGARLLAFYGQHEHRKLTLASAQLEILDGFAGAEHLALRARYRESHAAVLAVAQELAELRDRDGSRERDLDLMRFELEEIEAIEPDPSEEAELEAERERLRHAEGLRGAAGSALGAITGDGEGGARDALAAAESGLSAVSGVDAQLDALAERLRAAALELADIGSDVRAYLDLVEADPERLQAAEERLAAIDRLKRKHGGTVEAVLAHADNCRAEIERLANAEGRLAEVEATLSDAEKTRAALAAQLTAGRRDAAARLGERVAAELAELAMDGARLEARLEPHPHGFGPNGAETVELMVATNPGMPLSPLKDAASGGELSRIMLALTGLGNADSDLTLVFDEIDAGVGGNTARAVGERLRDLAAGRQVMCITHLPQVASLASTHFRISKSAAGGATTAAVERVAGDDLVAEIVRMLGADSDDAAASTHAKRLLKAA
jgi:DNA repair protein RecN (Recombination protein N)